VAAHAAPVARPALWSVLEPGPHAVGFTVVDLRDPARHAPAGAGRPVQVSLWYPARDGAAPPLRYADLVLVSASAATLATPNAASATGTLARYRGFLTSNGIPDTAATAWLDAPLLARRDARAAGGRFPLVLLAAGNGGAVEDQGVLGEFLASHGYVVATTPSPARLGDRMESDADVLPMARAQAADLAFALQALRRDPRVDATRLAVVGYSFGARSGLLLAAREPAVRAFVSLDGGIGNASAGPWLGPGDLDRAAFHVPLLHVYEDEDPALKPDFTLLDALAAPQWRVKIPGLGHMDLITLGFASATLPAMGTKSADRAALETRLATAFGTTLRFLDAQVKGDAAARQRLGSQNAGAKR
jgi:dienelactone hydrolase